MSVYEKKFFLLKIDFLNFMTELSDMDKGKLITHI
jgi:hypothetical protein